MRDMSLHILDIAENSITAGAERVEIVITEDTVADKLTIIVRDNGKGMSKEILRMVEDPFYTRKPGKNWGLGIPLLAQAARDCNGSFTIESEPGEGTEVRAEFQRSNIDTKPLGDMGSTVATLVCGHPRVDFMLRYELDAEVFRMDTRDVRQELEEVPINLPDVLRVIKEDINDGIRRIKG